MQEIASPLWRDQQSATMGVHCWAISIHSDFIVTDPSSPADIPGTVVCRCETVFAPSCCTEPTFFPSGLWGKKELLLFQGNATLGGHTENGIPQMIIFQFISLHPTNNMHLDARDGKNEVNSVANWMSCEEQWGKTQFHLQFY